MKALFIVAALLLFVAIEAQSQPGTLDASFGDNGVSLADLSAGNTDYEGAIKVFVDANAKRIVVVERDPYMQLIRFNSDGSYDDSFGQGGFSQAVYLRRFGGALSNAAMQSDGKIVVTGGTASNSTTFTDFGVARWNTDGTLDAAFDGDGFVTTNLGTWDEGKIVQIQPDGKILVAGEATVSAVTRFGFVRYNSDGSLDASFGSQGTHINQVFGDVDLVDMDLAPDGNILVLGKDIGNVDLLLARFLSSGGIDATFTLDGYEGYNLSATYSVSVDCMEIQTDGKILLGGTMANGVDWDMLVARYNADGTIDNSFDVDGLQTTHIGGSESVRDLALQADGKIVAAGYVSYSSQPTAFALARYQLNGGLDVTFGVDGIQITSFAGYEGAVATVVVVHPDGDITAAGGATKNLTADVAVATYDVHGTVGVDGFPVQQIIAYDADNGITIFQAFGVQPDGKLVAAGYAWNGNDFDFVIARFNTDGTLDQGFGNGGYRLTHFAAGGSGYDLATALAIQADGKIVVTGYFSGVVGTGLPVARYTPDGSLDASFDSDGLLLIDFPGIFDQGDAIVIQPDGKILIGGSNVTNHNSDLTLCRLNVNGSLDGGFGTGGIVETDFGSQDYVADLALQPDGKILATGNATDLNSATGYDFCVVRYNGDGTVDAGFGTNGRTTTDFGDIFDYAAAITLQSDGKIVVGGGARVNNDFEFALARYNADGTPDASFGNAGVQTTGFGGIDLGQALAVDSDGKLIVAGYSEGAAGTPEPRDIALARYNTNGVPDGEFGNAGKVTSDFNGQEIAYSIGLGDRSIFVAGHKRAFNNFTSSFKSYGLVAAYFSSPPPAEQVEDLIADINALLIQAGTKQSLNSKLQHALNRIEAGDEAGACQILQAFINEVSAQSGKKLTSAQAAQLIADAAEIMSALGCGLNKSADKTAEIPTEFMLEQNHPNPFNPSTRIRYSLPDRAKATMTVFNALGQQVATLVDGEVEAGFHEVTFDASALASGVYFYRLTAGNFIQTRKLSLIR